MPLLIEAALREWQAAWVRERADTIVSCRMATVTCSKCGTVLAGEGTTPPAQDAPCPVCGHIGQNVNVVVRGETVKIEAGVVSATIVDYSTSLLQEAGELLTHDRKFGLAIVVAHTACEVAAQRAFSRAFASRNVSDLEDAVSDLFSSYNLGNERVRKVYAALTGDLVGNALPSWWQPFKDSVQRRNDIVHEGKRPSQEEALESLNACVACVEYLNRNNP